VEVARSRGRAEFVKSVETKLKYIVGTSGYSFRDWVGTFYPAGTRQGEMFGLYVNRFEAVELNFTYYRMPSADTLERIQRRSPGGFQFWVKANQQTTHEQDRSVAREFIDNLAPLQQADKLSGVLLQFPQSFHRTVANRKYLAAAVEDFASVPLAVEFRHRSWDDPAVFSALRERNVTLAIPDVPDLEGLFRPEIAATARTGYFRLHSRDAEKWYAGAAERYNYSYSQAEMAAAIEAWERLADQMDAVHVFFNNCHGGQAAENAEAFRRILGQL
jgi:uncharacterized protein YecE (DUF72 family)